MAESGAICSAIWGAASKLKPARGLSLVPVEGGRALPYHPARRPVNDGALPDLPFRLRGRWSPMDPHYIIEVETEVVGCDGGGGALGHPLVYLNMEKQGA